MSFNISITPLGGVGKVGNSCVLYESERSSVVVDSGLDPPIFVRDSHTIVPPQGLDILDNRLRAGQKVSAFITHGHLDHCGAIGELLERDIAIRLSSVTGKFLYRYSEN